MRSILKKYDPKSIRINNMNHHPRSSQWEKVSKWWILKKQNKVSDLWVKLKDRKKELKEKNVYSKVKRSDPFGKVEIDKNDFFII